MTKESCTKVADLGLRRLRNTQDKIATELTGAVTRLKDAEARLLRTHIAMEDADWEEVEGFCQDAMLATRVSAQRCEDAVEECHKILLRLCEELGYDDPFSTGDSG